MYTLLLRFCEVFRYCGVDLVVPVYTIMYMYLYERTALANRIKTSKT